MTGTNYGFNVKRTLKLPHRKHKDVPDDECVECGSTIRVFHSFNHRRCSACVRKMWEDTYKEMEAGE